MMKIQLVRHATLIIHLNRAKILLDPMLGPVGGRPPIENSPNPRPNPLVPLPISLEEIMNVDAVLITHLHSDHLDPAAINLLPKTIPLFCQPADEEILQSHGFESVQAVHESLYWKGIHMFRTDGQHGTGEIGESMAPVSGYVLKSDLNETLYIAGDSIYCQEVETALRTFKPGVAVLNAGAAQFVVGDPITMTSNDVISVCNAFPEVKLVAVHMEAINHCLLSRSDLKADLTNEGYHERVVIPLDGEVVHF